MKFSKEIRSSKEFMNLIWICNVLSYKFYFKIWDKIVVIKTYITIFQWVSLSFVECDCQDSAKKKCAMHINWKRKAAAIKKNKIKY